MKFRRDSARTNNLKVSLKEIYCFLLTSSKFYRYKIHLTPVDPNPLSPLIAGSFSVSISVTLFTSITGWKIFSQISCAIRFPFLTWKSYEE